VGSAVGDSDSEGVAGDSVGETAGTAVIVAVMLVSVGRPVGEGSTGVAVLAISIAVEVGLGNGAGGGSRVSVGIGTAVAVGSMVG